MFRPEMLEPMGIPKGVRVLGWGLSLERPTMVKYVTLPRSLRSRLSDPLLPLTFPLSNFLQVQN